MTDDERMTKTKRWLEIKVDKIPDCMTCRWYHIDPDHCRQYSEHRLYGMCLNIKQANRGMRELQHERPE